MKPQAYDAEMTKHGDPAYADRVAWASGVLGITKWRIKVFLLPVEMADCDASTGLDRGKRKATIWMGKRNRSNRKILYHELAHIAISEATIKMSDQLEEEMVDWLAGMLRRAEDANV